MTNEAHRTETLAAEYGITFSVAEALSTDYFKSLEAQGLLDNTTSSGESVREMMIWGCFSQAVQDLSHNSKIAGWGYGQHCIANANHRMNIMGGFNHGWESETIKALHTAGFHLTSGFADNRM